MSISINHYTGINYTPAVNIIARAQLDLLESGMSGQVISTNWDDEIILACIDNTPVGVMTWKKIDWLKTIMIHIGWVDPKYRRQGVYTTMWNELIVKAKEQDVKRIESTTHTDNFSMRKVANKLRRVETSINLVYNLD